MMPLYSFSPTVSSFSQPGMHLARYCGSVRNAHTFWRGTGKVCVPVSFIKYVKNVVHASTEPVLSPVEGHMKFDPLLRSFRPLHGFCQCPLGIHPCQVSPVLGRGE